MNLELQFLISLDRVIAVCENQLAELECQEHFTYLDSAEYAMKNQLPF